MKKITWFNKQSKPSVKVERPRSKSGFLPKSTKNRTFFHSKCILDDFSSILTQIDHKPYVFPLQMHFGWFFINLTQIDQKPYVFPLQMHFGWFFINFDPNRPKTLRFSTPNAFWMIFHQFWPKSTINLTFFHSKCILDDFLSILTQIDQKPYVFPLQMHFGWFFINFDPNRPKTLRFSTPNAFWVIFHQFWPKSTKNHTFFHSKCDSKLHIWAKKGHGQTDGQTPNRFWYRKGSTRPLRGRKYDMWRCWFPKMWVWTIDKHASIQLCPNNPESNHHLISQIQYC